MNPPSAYFASKPTLGKKMSASSASGFKYVHAPSKPKMAPLAPKLPLLSCIILISMRCENWYDGGSAAGSTCLLTFGVKSRLA